MEEKIGAGWSLIGVVEAGFNPYSGMLINGPRSRADNNVNALANQTANYNSSRAGQWDNSQGFIGVSNPVYGRLTFGRTNSLSQDALSSYDPVASTAFSPLGFSGSFAGFGNSPTVRPNTAFTYRLSVRNFRVARRRRSAVTRSATPPTANIRVRSARTSAIFARWRRQLDQGRRCSVELQRQSAKGIRRQ